jgi:hypothetical protein
MQLIEESRVQCGENEMPRKENQIISIITSSCRVPALHRGGNTIKGRTDIRIGKKISTTYNAAFNVLH